jgi:hypothetical protein
MRWNLISHVLMWALMAVMAWDMLVAPHPAIVLQGCSS